jgi:hypothetical protein
MNWTICTISVSFPVNLSFLAQWFLRRIFNDSILFLWLRTLWRGSGLISEQFWIPYTQEWFVPSLIENSMLVLEMILTKISVFFLFCYHPPGQGRCHSFEQFWIPFPEGCFVPSLVKIDRVVLEKSKTDRHTDGRTGDGSLDLEVSAQVS